MLDPYGGGGGQLEQPARRCEAGDRRAVAVDEAILRDVLERAIDAAARATVDDGQARTERRRSEAQGQLELRAVRVVDEGHVACFVAGDRTRDRRIRPDALRGVRNIDLHRAAPGLARRLDFGPSRIAQLREQDGLVRGVEMLPHADGV